MQIVVTAERKSILKLGPCSFAIQSARWKDDPDPPLLGVDAEGALCLVVQRSGVGLAAIGPVTEARMRELGLDASIVAPEHSIPGLVSAITSYFARLDGATGKS